MKKIVFTGSESCGKSHSATLIATKFELQLVPEYAREYLHLKKRYYTYEDILKIATLQHDAEVEAVNNLTTDIIFDTDLITIKIWLQYINYKVPAWIENEIKKYIDRYYILMAPTIPWINDGLRNLEDKREDIHLLYKMELKKQGFSYYEIASSKDTRDLEVENLYKRLTTQIA